MQSFIQQDEPLDFTVVLAVSEKVQGSLYHNVYRVVILFALRMVLKDCIVHMSVVAMLNALHRTARYIQAIA